MSTKLEIETDKPIPPSNKLFVGVTTICGDEKAWSLSEIHQQSPNSRGFRRYQVIQVMRNDRRAEFRRDMGLAKNFKGIYPFTIPSFMVYSVDELLDIADHIRGVVNIDVKDLMQLDKFNIA